MIITWLVISVYSDCVPCYLYLSYLYTWDLYISLFGISVYSDCDWDLYISLFGLCIFRLCTLLFVYLVLFGLVIDYYLVCVPCYLYTLLFVYFFVCVYSDCDWEWVGCVPCYLCTLLFVYFFVIDICIFRL